MIHFGLFASFSLPSLSLVKRPRRRQPAEAAAEAPSPAPLEPIPQSPPRPLVVIITRGRQAAPPAEGRADPGDRKRPGGVQGPTPVAGGPGSLDLDEPADAPGREPSARISRTSTAPSPQPLESLVSFFFWGGAGRGRNEERDSSFEFSSNVEGRKKNPKDGKKKLNPHPTSTLSAAPPHAPFTPASWIVCPITILFAPGSLERASLNSWHSAFRGSSEEKERDQTTASRPRRKSGMPLSAPLPLPLLLPPGGPALSPRIQEADREFNLSRAALAASSRAPPPPSSPPLPLPRPSSSPLTRCDGSRPPCTNTVDPTCSTTLLSARNRRVTSPVPGARARALAARAAPSSAAGPPARAWRACAGPLIGFEGAGEGEEEEEEEEEEEGAGAEGEEEAEERGRHPHFSRSCSPTASTSSNRRNSASPPGVAYLNLPPTFIVSWLPFST